MTENNGSNQIDAAIQEPAAAEAPCLDSSEATNRAAEWAKSTAMRNITELEGLPIPDKTANLCFGPNIHDGLLALLPLAGVWRGEGRANIVVDGEYNSGQQVIFSHDGESYPKYESRIWKLDGEGKLTDPDRCEAGSWRINNDDKTEFTCVHSTGVTEAYYGELVFERAWELRAASTMVTATGPASLGPSKRLYGLTPDNDFGRVDKRLQDEGFVPRMFAQFKRYAG